jgi:hypothetical protein
MKRVILSLSGKRGLLCIQRLVPIVEVNPHTTEILEVNCETGERTETEIKVTPSQLDRGYGFGSFLLSLSADQIGYDHNILDFLKPCINRQYSSIGDLFGFSLSAANQVAYNEEFRTSHLCYGSLNPILTFIPAEDCQIDLAFYKEMEYNLHNAA